ncbi:MAG: hypothetical protein IT576_01345, partial [Verrucomicrobiales bacterium]|nr:hypothetical protein [Verrucomicrobiales bacterium]
MDPAPLSPSLPDPGKMLPADTEIVQGTSLGRDAWLRLRKNRLAIICLWVLVGIVALCLIGSLLSK